MAENELKPVDISAAKSSTSRIDLSKATIPGSPGATNIRIGANPKKATSRIDINAIPGAAKAQTSRMGLGAMPPDDDIYKRRTTLLDTSKIPLGAVPAQPAASQPRTIRIGGRPTVRVGGAAAPVTFSPGRQAEAETAAPAPAGGGRPTIKLKRPGGAGGGVAVNVGGGDGGLSPEPLFTIQADEGPGAVWAVLSLVSMLVAVGLVVVQVLTLNAAAY
jgi:hypothetical protein